jgi:hypothetical protein
MSDPLSVLAITVMVVTGLSLALARLIPDEYDRRAHERVPSRPRATR